MDWRASLDNYLTNPPEDNFTPWVEEVMEKFSEEFFKEAYQDRDDWEESSIETKWLEKTFHNSKYEDLDDDGNWTTFGAHTPESAAKVIERAYRIYIKK